MKSAICKINNGKGKELLLKETEKLLIQKNLNQKSQLQLRLLAEEMLGMCEAIVGKYSGEFWIESDGSDFQLHLFLDINLTSSERKKLLEVSSSKKNSAATGFMGWIREFFLLNISSYEESGVYHTQDDAILKYITGVYSTDNSGAEYVNWNLRNCKEILEQQKCTEAFEGLEKSIVASIADDVSVSIKKKQVEVIVSKKF